MDTTDDHRTWFTLRGESPYLLVSSIVFLLCIAIAYPFANSGFIDDWSYADVALHFAKTGHFQYSGWGSPSVVFQSAWAAIWLRLFGFSFDLLRVITLPFSLAFVLLTYALGRKIGLSRNFALFASLIVATSPLFLPLACTFMTEPYACALTLLCIYAALCSADASSSSRAVAWLWLLTACAILGGSDRQTVWVAPIVLIPYLIWKRRSDRSFQISAILAYVACLAALIIIVKYLSPAYAPTALSRHQLLTIFARGWFTAAHRVVCILVVAMLMGLPAFFSGSKIWTQLKARQILVIVVLCMAALAFASVGSIDLVPYMGAIMTVAGILPVNIDGLGLKPILLSKIVQHALTFIFYLAVTLWAYVFWRRNLLMGLSRSSATVFLLFTCAYLPLLFPGGLTGFIFDRYALPLLPLVVVAVLLPVQSAVKNVPVLAYICLALFAGYAIVTTHDYFATLRARATAAGELETRGVPPANISVGFEHDTWTQVQLTGHIGTLMYGDDCTTEKFWVWYYTPAIQPAYVAVSFQLKDKVHNQILQVPYLTWTRPFRRKVSIVRPVDIPHSVLMLNPQQKR